MRKSKITKFLALATLLLATFSFIACGGNGAGGGDDSSSGSDSGSSSSSSSSSSGGSNSPTEFTGITAEQKAKLDALNGWEVTINHKWSDTGEEDPEEQTWIIGEKDDVFWADMEGSKCAVEKVGENVYFYNWDEDEGEFKASSEYGEATLTAEYYDFLTLSAYMWLFWKDMYDGTDLKNAGSATVCNRPCTKYTWSGSAAALGQWATASITFWVDNATGITMKLEAGSASNEGSESYTHEITEFKTGDAVTPPTLS